MDDKRVYPRITITLEPSVYAKLPKRDRSAVINLVLKQHYQKEGAEQLYEAFKYKLMRDKDMSEWIEFTVREVR